MLVVARKTLERIIIGDSIIITITDISHGKVKVAIEAPANVRVYREELLDRSDVELVERNSKIGRTNK